MCLCLLTYVIRRVSTYDWMSGVCLIVFMFFKQKTAYEMRISDWSSDVCSSDLSRPESFLQRRGFLSPPVQPWPNRWKERLRTERSCSGSKTSSRHRTGTGPTNIWNWRKCGFLLLPAQRLSLQGLESQHENTQRKVFAKHCPFRFGSCNFTRERK